MIMKVCVIHQKSNTTLYVNCYEISVQFGATLQLMFLTFPNFYKKWGSGDLLWPSTRWIGESFEIGKVPLLTIPILELFQLEALKSFWKGAF